LADTFFEINSIIPDRRIFRVMGYEVDITRIPAKYTLEMMKLKSSGDDSNPENITKMIDIIAGVCQISQPAITREWLLENLDFTEISQLGFQISQSVNTRTQTAQTGIEGTTEKNA
jgi:hypothetical protein